MKSFRHRLPPLNGLLIFEAAARHLNFTLAAQELHVTQAAVSKQIKELEHHLGVSLFVRNGRRVALTGDGHYLQTKVGASLQFLCEAVEAVGAATPPRGIVLSANTAMSQLWLGPAMRRFDRAHDDPGGNIRLLTSDITSELLGDEVDLAVLYDVREHDGWQLTPLFAEELFPVASPGYLDLHGRRLDSVSALRDHALLDFDRIEPNWVDWRRWLEGLGADTDWLTPSAHYSHYAALIEAAEQGQGVALGTRHQIDARLGEGRLERLGEIGLRTGRHYWLGLNLNHAPTQPVARLHDWLLDTRE
ncbi:LysR substrate-binding domain-containing protein [Halomonas smyrnensis]|uniref:LysR substrate-binding domain-containing protein n=1 Tax=Halomonas smyrnensis TaxID=720605 RepID=UPI0002FDA67C|nr:LysR substrate-binding domain-containing protein [Halomonas smyrnensis]